VKEILYTAYGPTDVLQLTEIEKPAPKENEVLVRVYASSINALEWRRFTMPRFLVPIMGGGIREPKDKTIGGDLSGRVEAIGANVTRFKPGDEVFGVRRGAFAEYVCAAEDKLVSKPANISFEGAAAVPIAGLTALRGVRDKGKIQPGKRVLVYGAGGGVGMFAVQIGKAFEAEVTAVCGARNLELVRSCGADHVMDYNLENLIKSSKRYDLIVAVDGYQSIFDYWRALTPNGMYVMIGGSAAQLFQALLLAPFLNLFGSKKMLGMMTRPFLEDLVVLKDLLETGKMVPVIDRCYPLAKTAEAVRYVMEGHPRGMVIITIDA
jgi:NADPH:quinone reductase-like Zn-dependent oxidoreductase